MQRNNISQKRQGPDITEVDAIVVGAGFGGLYAVHRLRNHMDLNVQAFDAAQDVGGTWYWNRYPGALSDTESYCYRYSFDPELLQEGSWERRYLTQPEILRYLSDFADRYYLKRSYTFGTRVTDAVFEEATERWTVKTDRGNVISAKYLITGLGLLSVINKPPFRGVDDFRGRIFHTGAWPAGVNLEGQRVGVIGTGSTGVQVIMALAPIVKHLTVFQRSAQYVVPIGNWHESPEDIAAYKARYPEIWNQIKDSAVAFGFEESTITADSVSADERERIFEQAWQDGGGFRFMFATFSDIATSDFANAEAAEFIRRKIAQVVTDPEVARKLTPTDLYAKRPLCGDNYYEVFNEDHVELVDIKTDPIAEITKHGIRTESGAEHELDVLILATGFDAVDGNYTRMNLRGRGGLSIRDKWREGPRGYLGMMEADFPNFFMILGPNGPFTNLPPSIETQVEWIAETIARTEERGHRTIEPSQDAADAWLETCASIADMTLFPKAQSWIFGANIPGKKNAVMFYMGGLRNYRAALDDVVATDYSTLHFDRSRPTA